MVFKFKVKSKNEGEKPFFVAVNTVREDHKASLEALSTFREEYDEENYSLESFSKTTHNSVDIQEGEDKSIYTLSCIPDVTEGRAQRVNELVWTSKTAEEIIKGIPVRFVFKSLVKEEIEEIL
jgi:hypothetical protein